MSATKKPLSFTSKQNPVVLAVAAVVVDAAAASVGREPEVLSFAGRKKMKKIRLQANADEIRRQKPETTNLAAALLDAAAAIRDAAAAIRDAAVLAAIYDVAPQPNVCLGTNICIKWKIRLIRQL